MKAIFCSLFGLSLGRSAFLAGREIARWSDADQMDYVAIPTVAVLLAYAAGLTLVLVAIGNGWLRSKSDEPQ